MQLQRSCSSTLRWLIFFSLDGVNRLAPFWLLFIGVVWLLIAIWLMLVMSGISTPAVATWLLLLLYFAAPAALIASAILLLRSRCPRVAAIVVLLASAYLTYIIAPSFISLFQPRAPLEAPTDYIDYTIFTALAVAVLLTDLVAVATARHAVKHHLTKR
jgi:hypothetical protein